MGRRDSGAAAGSAPIASAASITIINPSFEQTSRPLALGEQTNGVGGAGVPLGTRFPFIGGGSTVSWNNPVEVPGWRTQVAPFGSPGVNRRGVLNPPMIGDQPFITGQHGQYVAAAQLGLFQQTLDHQLLPNTRYRLDFLAGIGRTDTDYFAGVSLLAAPDLETLAYPGTPNVTTLAQAEDSQLPGATAGTLLPFSLEYTTPALLPAELSGRYLAIACFGSDGFPRVVYDHFRLEATVIPEPAPWLAVTALLPLMRGGRRHGHSKAPSETDRVRPPTGSKGLRPSARRRGRMGLPQSARRRRSMASSPRVYCIRTASAAG